MSNLLLQVLDGYWLCGGMHSTEDLPVLHEFLWLCLKCRYEDNWSVYVLACATVEEFQSDVV